MNNYSPTSTMRVTDILDRKYERYKPHNIGAREEWRKETSILLSELNNSEREWPSLEDLEKNPLLELEWDSLIASKSNPESKPENLKKKEPIQIPKYKF